MYKLWGGAQIQPQNNTVSVTLSVSYTKTYVAFAIHAATDRNEALGISRNSLSSFTVGKDTPNNIGAHTLQWLTFGQ